MNTFKALLLREYWEHRGAFLKTPLIIGAITIVILLLGYFTTERFDMKINSGQAIELGAKQLENIDPSDITMVFDWFMLFTGSIYHFVLFIVIFFFLLGSLYDDRKDGSILFWKSLPVSDLQTVLSKLVTAVIVVPLIFTACLIISHLAIYLVLSLLFLFNGINPFTLLWPNIEFINNWGAFLIGCLAQAAWAMPIYGWLLFASSYSKRRPFLLAVFAPLLAGFAWYWYNAIVEFNVLKIGVLKTIGILMAKATTPFTSGLGFDFENVDFDPTEQTNLELIRTMLNGLTSSNIYYGLLFAAVVIALAVYVRRYRNTT
jgi:ABC-2 type transport system permease protein